MIGAGRFFARRMFAPRYWLKIGANGTGGFQVAWARYSNVLLGRRRAS